MQKTTPAADPDAYVASLRGWQRACVVGLRAGVHAAGPTLDERIKWGHLVYQAAGPVCLIRAEERRVLFGFWRGQRLREIEPRLKPGGKSQLATLELLAGSEVSPATVRRLVREAIRLNADLGDPTDLTVAGGLAARVRASTAKRK